MATFDTGNRSAAYDYAEELTQDSEAVLVTTSDQSYQVWVRLDTAATLQTGPTPKSSTGLALQFA
ncbi:hypothetical protein [Stenomitos frigidus]|uniref:Uncharacterized protein n=1 Tax=Stenomitos frigidus ULC18 TaxID=2107698 RepID=A0A2T1E8M2_9CYAN|nr:hypothetical protein [Stenomitos frigidus]PSB29087.1 hypothetical protein C7B82_12290 [Stenomitos frigidus ULC18]